MECSMDLRKSPERRRASTWPLVASYLLAVDSPETLLLSGPGPAPRNRQKTIPRMHVGSGGFQLEKGYDLLQLPLSRVRC